MTSGLEVFSVSEAAEISARALAAEEKSKREAQMQASNINKLQAESQKLRAEKQKEDVREQEKKRVDQEQKEKAEIAIQSANAERTRIEQSERDCNIRISTDVKRAAAPVKSGAYNGVKFHASGLAEGIKPLFMRTVI